MKYGKTVFLAALVLALGLTVLASCEKRAPETMTPTAIVTELSAQKEQYIKELQATVDEYQANIDELKGKAETMTGTAKDEMNQKIAMLTAKQEEARGKIAEVKDATAETWDKVKAGSDLILSDLETLYRDALSIIK